jgi:hypothetical protein
MLERLAAQKVNVLINLKFLHRLFLHFTLMEGMLAKRYSYMLYSADCKGIIKHICTSKECIFHETVNIEWLHQ